MAKYFGLKQGFRSASMQFCFDRFATIPSFPLENFWEKITEVIGVGDELRKLQRTFLKIQDLVNHVENSRLRLSTESKAWQIWFEDLRKLAYDADALVDYVSLRLLEFNHWDKLPVAKNGQRRTKFSSREKLPDEISAMQKKLEELAQEMKSLVKMEKLKMDIHKYKSNEKSYDSSSLVDVGDIVGREKDKQKVVNFLDKNGLSVISLVGIGGIGKSTLARLIFNDKDVSSRFMLKIWVSAFEFDVVRITKMIIESATQSSCSLSDLDSLQHKLRQIFMMSEGRLLLVLDDYWNENQDDWELLCRPIRSAFERSKIIVTTRSAKVPRIVGSDEACNLEVLSNEDCWLLMKKRAFFKREEKEILEPLGREIAEKCHGLPLAAKTLGSVLQNCKNFTEDEWRSILKSELWDLPGDVNNSVFASLMISYIHLPAHLQKCFAYCSVFPQNHDFQVEELVHLWMAEGFIQTGNQERTTEEIGNYYFQDLLCRLFFVQGTKETIYRMHPLIHDLACLVSKDACLRLKLDDKLHCNPLFRNACHLSLHHDNIQEQLKLKVDHKNERLRTFLVICKHGASGGQVDSALFNKLKFVRVLDLSDIGLGEVPDTIGDLIYLRYINLSRNSIQRLPESICNLLALETLKLVSCPHFSELPSQMRNLSSLRHLIFPLISSMPVGFGELTNLQTLSWFVVGRRKGHGVEELENMNLLRGHYP